MWWKGKRKKKTVFNEKTLKKCAEILKIRSERGFKFGKITLPRTVNSKNGYHARCYREFTAVSSKYLTPKPTTIVEVTGTTTPTPSTSHELETTPPPLPLTSGEVKTSYEPTKDARFHVETFTPTKNLFDMNEVMMEDKSTQTPTTKSSHPEPAATAEASTSTDADTAAEKTCLFCDRYRLRLKKTDQLPMFIRDEEAQVFAKDAFDKAELMSDSKMMEKMNDIRSSPDKSVGYHKLCRIRYSSRYRDFVAAAETEREWHTRRKCNKMAYEELCLFIQDNILENRRCYLLKFLSHVYNAAVARINEENDYNLPTIHVRNNYVKEKIMFTYAQKIKAHYVSNRILVAPADMIVDATTLENLKDTDEMQGTALGLREMVFNVKKKSATGKANCSRSDERRM